jgi:hypothetical protein
VRLTLSAALAWCRMAEITDALVDLLIGLISKINAKAERRVEQAMYAEVKTVHGKTAKLYSSAEASLRAPDDPVRAVVFLARSRESWRLGRGDRCGPGVRQQRRLGLRAGVDEPARGEDGSPGDAEQAGRGSRPFTSRAPGR